MESEAVHEYLADLEAAAASLGTERRAELVAEVHEHIELALVEAGRTDEATVREVLGRLGSPIEIVAAETTLEGVASEGDPTLVAVGQVRRPLTVETRALLLLTVGAVVLPFIGPALGLWVAAASTRWTLTQKRTAVLIFLVLCTMPFVLLVPAVLAGEFMWIVGSAGFSLPLVPLAGIVAAAYLVASSSLVLTVSRKT